MRENTSEQFSTSYIMKIVLILKHTTLNAIRIVLKATVKLWSILTNFLQEILHCMHWLFVHRGQSYFFRWVNNVIGEIVDWSPVWKLIFNKRVNFTFTNWLDQIMLKDKFLTRHNGFHGFNEIGFIPKWGMRLSR